MSARVPVQGSGSTSPSHGGGDSAQAAALASAPAKAAVDAEAVAEREAAETGRAREAADVAIAAANSPASSDRETNEGNAASGFDRARFRRLFVAVMLPMFLAAVDQTLLATATPVIGRELGGLSDTSWLAVGYLLASVIMVPLYGRLGDRHGRRKLLSGAIGVFALGSLACGVAPTLPLLVAARVLQGLGGGGLMTLSQALIGEVVSPRQRARNQAYFATIFTLASVGGPVIGGLVVHHASWRWLFFVNLPLCAIALWRLRPLLGDDRRHAAMGKSDVVGIVLFAFAAATTLVWLSSAGHRFAWTSPPSFALLAAAVAFTAALIAVERRAERPFLPFELLALPAVRYAVLTVLGFASAMFAMIFYLPIYLQLALGSNPAESGVLLLPLTGGIVVGAALTGRIIVWTGRPTAIPGVGLCVAASGLFGLALLPSARPLLVGLEIVTGLGLGSVMSVMQIVTQTAAGPARLGAAASTVSLARTLGSSLGASAFGALIFGVIGGGSLRPPQAASHPLLDHAFQFAFAAAGVLCLCSAWAASRVPTLRFDAEHPATPSPAVD